MQVSNRRAAPITVVVPAHNSHTTIGRCLQSIVDQTLPISEIIVVDDGSASESRRQMRTIVDHFSSVVNLKLIELPSNVGPANARNIGWDLSSQEWVAFIDSDDTWLRNKLDLQYQWMLQHSSVQLSGHGVSTGRRSAEMAEEFEGKILTPRKLLLQNPIATSSVLVRRDVALRFPTDGRYS